MDGRHERITAHEAGDVAQGLVLAGLRIDEQIAALLQAHHRHGKAAVTQEDDRIVRGSGGDLANRQRHEMRFVEKLERAFPELYAHALVSLHVQRLGLLVKRQCTRDFGHVLFGVGHECHSPGNPFEVC